ncbi:hypothetical protein A1395_22080 [Pseudomonas protegens]|uniref:hypothetical protein n=1 Tax=Pseudomonas protegens TaxID=380021 RepID=UPI000C9B77F5|nr:hypothetical protein [Pseudomonas protegens]PNG32198.1 hypothetical protein A1395_22080 [Pseudomonas protegens]
MSKSGPFIGKTTESFSDAFPDVTFLSIKVTQDTAGWYTEREGANIQHMNLSNVSRQIGCLNKKCRNGGLDLQNIIRLNKTGTTDYYCKGSEGASNRDSGDPCDNRFIVELEITRKAN